MDHKDYGLIGIGSNVELGKSQARLKANTTSISARNPADGAFVVVKGADPVDYPDLVTLSYLEEYVLTHNATGIQGEANQDVVPMMPATGTVILVTREKALAPVFKLNDLLIFDSVGGMAPNWRVMFDSSVDGGLPNWDGYVISMTYQTTEPAANPYLADHLYMWDNATTKWKDIGPQLADSNVSGDRRVSLDETTGAPGVTTAIGGTIPAGSVIKKATVNVRSAFDGDATLSLGIVGTVDLLMTAAEINLQAVGVYIVKIYVKPGVDTQYNATYTKGTSTVGIVDIVVDYTTA